MNYFQNGNYFYWFTKLTVAPQPDRLDPKCLWDLETRYTELEVLSNTLNPIMIYLLVGMILKKDFKIRTFIVEHKQTWLLKSFLANYRYI